MNSPGKIYVALWAHFLLCNMAQNKLQDVRLDYGTDSSGERENIVGPGLAREESVLLSAIIPQQGKPQSVFLGRGLIHL